ncbi:MAG: hypothetical protein C0469_07190 [Cyanobacteria bacterium DS2.3.42]|nr:hypothetical protein [Cyanobacteria bacterium DS2.3.42]
MGNYHARFYEGLGRGDAPSLLSAGNNSEFVYDGFWRNTKIVETVSGSIISTKQFIWSSSGRSEERNASSLVTKKFFTRGEEISSNAFFYARSHLGSVSEITDNGGTIEAQYGYDSYGRNQKFAGIMDADFGFDGYYNHFRSSLSVTQNRSYSASLARWINRDPIGEAGGKNLYTYVNSNPVSYSDPSGLVNAQMEQVGQQVIQQGNGAPPGFRLIFIIIGGIIIGTSLLPILDPMMNGGGQSQEAAPQYFWSEYVGPWQSEATCQTAAFNRFLDCLKHPDCYPDPKHDDFNPESRINMNNTNPTYRKCALLYDEWWTDCHTMFNH